MPKHYAIGTNFQSGRMQFTDSRIGIVTFMKDFNKKPNIQISLEDNGAEHVPWKINCNISGFTIKFKTNYTGYVTWDAKEV